MGGCGDASAGVGRRLAVRLVHDAVVVGVGLGAMVASAGSGGSVYDVAAALFRSSARSIVAARFSSPLYADDWVLAQGQGKLIDQESQS